MNASRVGQKSNGSPLFAVQDQPSSSWSLVLSYLKKHWWIYLIAVTLIIGSSRLAVLIPRLIGRFTDQLQKGTLGFHEAAHFAVILAIVGFFRVITLWAGRIIINGHGRILVYNLRKELLAKWSTLSRSYYHRHSVGDLLSHALSDVEVVRQFASMGISQSINCFSLLIATLYVMSVHMNWRLAVAGMGPLIIIPVVVKYFGPKIKAQSMRYQESLGSMAQMVEESIGGIRTVKAFGNEAVIEGRFEKKAEKIIEEKVKFVRLSALFRALIPLQANIGFIVVMGYGSYLTINHTISLGDFVAFLLYLNLLRQPLEQMGQMLNVVQRASGSLSRISQLLSVAPEIADDKADLKKHDVRGNIQVKNLTFRYPGTKKVVLVDVSFEVDKGKTVGIIGAIGEGKTTLVNLLLRLYNPPKDTVFIDGVDILKIPLEDLRRGIAYVPQNGFLFSTTILENIGFSDGKPDEERAETAAKVSMVYDNIMKFPEGFGTEIGERGVRLSGGQKQRVAIARMIYKDAPIQILDDSLSAVDTKTEQALLGNLQDIDALKADTSTDKTNIIISHRLSAVRHADKILVLSEGRISERGTHDQLVALGGLYSRLWLMQSGVVTESEALKATVPEEPGVLRRDLEEEEDFLPSGMEAEPS
jgi:ATP-binding cassette subfamily B protein